MNSSKIISAISTLLVLLAAEIAAGQSQTLAERCAMHQSEAFVSDGQEHIAPLKPKAEFRTTFFGHNTYRLAVCSTVPNAKLVMSVYDTDKNLLFCNRQYDYSPYWDFSFTSTVTCIVLIEIEKNAQTPIPSSATAMLSISFKP